MQPDSGIHTTEARKRMLDGGIRYFTPKLYPRGTVQVLEIFCYCVHRESASRASIVLFAYTDLLLCVTPYRGSRRVSFHPRYCATVTVCTYPQHWSIKPISTALLHQSASFLSCRADEEFVREFLFDELKNFSRLLHTPCP